MTPQEADQIVRQRLAQAMSQFMRMDHIWQAYVSGQIRTAKEALDRCEGAA